MTASSTQPTRHLSAETVARLVALLRGVLGEKAQLHSYRTLHHGPDYLVLSVTLAQPNRRVVVKLAGPNAPLPCSFERTAAIHRLVRARTSVPVAGVPAADTTYSRWPWRYAIQEQMPGIQWAQVYPTLSGRELRDAYRQIGQAVGELHSLAMPAFGELSNSGHVEDGAPYLATLEKRARLRIKDPRHADLFAGVLHARADLFSRVSDACLDHEDLHKHNLLFSRDAGCWKLSAVLDFDSAWAGSNESDLARMEFWDGMTGPGFWEGYYEVQSVGEEYSLRKPVYQLLWCLEYAQPTARHLADTQALCSLLGVAHVLHFE